MPYYTRMAEANRQKIFMSNEIKRIFDGKMKNSKQKTLSIDIKYSKLE